MISHNESCYLLLVYLLTSLVMMVNVSPLKNGKEGLTLSWLAFEVYVFGKFIYTSHVGLSKLKT